MSTMPGLLLPWPVFWAGWAAIFAVSLFGIYRLWRIPFADTQFRLILVAILFLQALVFVFSYSSVYTSHMIRELLVYPQGIQQGE